MSDHKPVFCGFEVDIQAVDAVLEWEVYKGVVQMMDRYENDSLPRVKVDSNFVDLGLVSMGGRAHGALVVENVGSSIAYWSIIEDGVVDRDWLLVEPSAGMILPGSCTNISLVAHLRPKHAACVDKQELRLEAILVLRVRGGGDLFCVVNAQMDTNATDFSSSEVQL
jgi:hypothetical protein